MCFHVVISHVCKSLCVCVCVCVCVLAVNTRCSSWSRPCRVPAPTGPTVLWSPPCFSIDDSLRVQTLKCLSAPSSAARHNNSAPVYQLYTGEQPAAHLSFISFFFFCLAVCRPRCVFFFVCVLLFLSCVLVSSSSRPPNKRSPARLCDVSQGG